MATTLMTELRYQGMGPTHCKRCSNPMRVMSRTRARITWARCDRCGMAWFGGQFWTRSYNWDAADQERLEQRIADEAKDNAIIR